MGNFLVFSFLVFRIPFKPRVEKKKKKDKKSRELEKEVLQRFSAEEKELLETIAALTEV